MTRHAFTLIEVLVVVAIIALLIALLIPSLALAREVSKRSVCVSNEHQLAMAWALYTMENKSNLVGSTANWMEGSIDGTTAPIRGWLDSNAPAWIKAVSWTSLPERWPADWQQQAIRKGALFKYARSLDMYHCPATKRNELITYGMSIPLNGGYPELFPFSVERGLWAKRMDDIHRPAERFNFLDHIPNDPDFSWITRDANDPRFWPIKYSGHFTDKLSGRHTKGTVYAFCDGHAEYWRWTTPDMRRFSVLDHTESPPEDFGTKSMKTDRDFLRLSRALWGHRFNTSWWP